MVAINIWAYFTLHIFQEGSFAKTNLYYSYTQLSKMFMLKNNQGAACISVSAINEKNGGGMSWKGYKFRT